MWTQMVPLFSIPPAVHWLIYTTISVECLKRTFRKVIKTRTLFPAEAAAHRVDFLAIRSDRAPRKDLRDIGQR